VTRRGPLVLGLLLLLARAGVPAPPPDGASPAPRGGSVAERLQLVQQRRAQLAAELQKLRGQEQGLLGDVERLDLEVRLRTEQLRETQLQLAKANEELDAVVRQGDALTAQIAAARPALAARARSLYELGELSYVRMLLSVDRPSDVFRGYRLVTSLARRDRQRIARFRDDLAQLSQTRLRLQERSAEATRLRGELEERRRALDAVRRGKTDLLTPIVQQKETQAAFVQELEQAEQRLDGLVQGLGDSQDESVPLGVFKGQLPWPVKGKVRSGFGRHRHGRLDTATVQNGIDIDVPLETPVAAVHDGTVVFADRFRGYGLMVVLDHGGKQHTLYAHLSEAAVEVGQRVFAGEIVGRSGGTGLEGPGLYFEVRSQGHPEDPQEWLEPRPRD
jgi:septal ring factor EnvC (AmiA/AmiB activator)